MSKIIDPAVEAARQATRVAVCTPCQDQVAAGFAFDLGRMLGATAHQLPDVELRLFFNKGTLIANQRHELVLQALHADCTHILWLDSDMRFPKHTLARLLSHAEPVVAASYATRRWPIEPVAFLGPEERLYTTPESEGLEEVLAVGMGAMLVDCDVYRQIPAPWFVIGYNPQSSEYTGEDLYFSHVVRQAGLRILVDHDLSKEVGHIGEWEYRHEHALAHRPAPAVIGADSPNGDQ